MPYQSILLERAGSVATITLNRPDAYNALTLPLARELFQAVLEVDEDPAVRCVVLTGAGKAFCGGGDVKDFADSLPRVGILLKELTTFIHGAVSRLTRSPKPVLVAVNGVAAGGGVSLALSGDLVVAAESARFTMAYSKIAAPPDGSSSYFLPRLIGLRRALELYLTNRVLSAREALEWGLVTKVVPDAELRASVTGLAGELGQGPTLAIGAAKRLFHQSTHESLETQMELESQAIAAAGHTEDFREGVTAFAAVTRQVELVSGILILPQRQAALVAKQAATVDVLCGGRLRLGVAVGWNPVEFDALGEQFGNRGQRIEEQIEVLRALWTRELVTFEGRWHRIPDAGINPLPVQRPIPVWMGGESEPVLGRAARLADGWFPHFRPGPAAQGIVDRLHRQIKDIGREPPAFGIEGRLTLAQVPPGAWAGELVAWRAMRGVTHLCVPTG